MRWKVVVVVGEKWEFMIFRIRWMKLWFVVTASHLSDPLLGRVTNQNLSFQFFCYCRLVQALQVFHLILPQSDQFSGIYQ